MDNINPDRGNIKQIFNMKCGGIHQPLGLEGS